MVQCGGVGFGVGCFYGDGDASFFVDLLEVSGDGNEDKVVLTLAEGCAVAGEGAGDGEEVAGYADGFADGVEAAGKEGFGGFAAEHDVVGGVADVVGGEVAPFCNGVAVGGGEVFVGSGDGDVGVGGEVCPGCLVASAGDDEADGACFAAHLFSEELCFLPGDVAPVGVEVAAVAAAEGCWFVFLDLDGVGAEVGKAALNAAVDGFEGGHDGDDGEDADGYSHDGEE